MNQLPPVPPTQPSAGVPHPGSAPMPAGTPAPPRPGVPPWVVALLVVVVVVVAGGGVFLLTGDDDEDGQGQRTTTPDSGNQPITTTAPTDDPPANDPSGSEGDEGTGSSSSGGDPTATVEQYIAAAGRDDCEAMLDLVTDNYVFDNPEGWLSDCEAGLYGDDVMEVAGSATFQGDTAIVPIELPEYDAASDIVLVLEDGAWLMDRMSGYRTG